MKTTIKTRIIFGFSAVLTVCIGIGIFIIVELRTIDRNATTLTRDAMPGYRVIVEVGQYSRRNYANIVEMIAITDKAKQAEREAEISKNRDHMSQLLKQYQDMAASNPQDKALTDKLNGTRPPYNAAAVKVIGLIREGRTSDAITALENELVPEYNKVLAALQDLEKFNSERGGLAAKNIAGSVASAKTGTWGGYAVLTTMVIAIAVVILVSINRALSAIADLLNEGAAQVASAAGQVASTSQTLAQGASEQAASLEETSASLEEMASMTHKNAQSADSAKELTAMTRSMAEVSSQNLTEMSSAMQEVQKIVKTIDEIAFQTNILALNAAVEAARAGEAGAGFAVVADEVRNLAHRSAEAAKQTAEKIDMGVGISKQVAEAVEQIVPKVCQVDELVGEIASGSKEQSQGVDQINTAVGQMDKVTQSNAASAEEGASAAEELNAQSESLKEAVQRLVELVHGRKQQSFEPKLQPKRATLSVTNVATDKGAKLDKTVKVVTAVPIKDPKKQIPLESEFKNF